MPLFRVRCLVVAVAAAAALGGGTAVATPTGPSTGYYLALGDSLAAGFQTLPTGHYLTGRGYAQDIARVLAARAGALGRGFSFTDLGCPGETTRTMIDGGCGSAHPYRGAQLAVAEAFLRAHRADEVRVTLDIGANDVDYCLSGGLLDLGCALVGIARLGPELGAILTGLQAAAGPRTRIVCMNFYDPFLAAYLRPGGELPAAATVPLAALLNSGIAATCAAHHIPTADVATAFATDRVSPLVRYGDRTVPLDVARVMQLTNMARDDIHANDAGYRVIAGAFLPFL